ncbi:MAG TPA: hypothetical protein VF088_08060 [Pyrinomonadaceae bacterium]
MNKTFAKDSKVFLSIYSILLLAYPREFRREYGPQMVLLLLDCQRDTRNRSARVRLWLHTLLDLFRTVPGEHLQNIRKETQFMSRIRTDLVAIGGCVLLIIIAMLLLNYGRSHQVSSILFFGYVLDAIAFTGIVGNLIVFLLVKLTRLRSLRVALWTFLIVSVVLLLAAIAIAGRVDPNFNATSVVIGYIVSFFFWYGLHWLWAQKLKPSEIT